MGNPISNFKMSLTDMRRFHFLLVALFLGASPTFAADEPRPNILWISSEDHGPQMGCYGDTYATTPSVDKLAARGMIYAHVWSCAPVCAPARTTIISGLYPPSTGSEHMRSMVAYPAGKQMFPQLLREAGYYCSNNAKEDYNIAQPGKVWDDSSNKAHWRNRHDGQPFFAVFNSLKSHESQIRKRPHKAIHDPAQVRIPAYHPDTPESRQDWAQYYDQVTQADADAGRRLKELENDGLAGDTIVFYWADHGPGMPRCKRWPGDSGLHVPLVVYIPEKFKHLAPADYKRGGKSDRLISFIDFAPTVLALAGIPAPAWLQGQAFLGRNVKPGPQFLHGFRGRMDERYDLVRSVTDGRFVYLRNFMPHQICGQHVEYMFQTPTTLAWKKLHDQGKLTRAQDIFWNPKPPEELYDLQNDLDEVANLATSAAHAGILNKLRQAQYDHALEIRDVGFLPEGEIHERSKGAAPYDMGLDDATYPLKRILAMANLATDYSENPPALREGLHDRDSAVRYWAALGMLIRGQRAVAANHDALDAALSDHSKYVQIVAAEALGRFGDSADTHKALDVLLPLTSLENHGVFVAVAALTSLDELGDRAKGGADRILKLTDKGKVPDPRYEPYVPRLLADLQAKFK
jgi:uncharacterized sulfatase